MNLLKYNITRTTKLEIKNGGLIYRRPEVKGAQLTQLAHLSFGEDQNSKFVTGAGQNGELPLRLPPQPTAGRPSSPARLDFAILKSAAAPLIPSFHPTVFPSYTDIPNLPPKIKLICEIIATTPPIAVERVLDGAGISVTQAEAEQVLKLSYSSPATSVKFFRWSGLRLSGGHSPYAWNLVVDLLGKNRLFDAMWGSVKSMRLERLVSSATFASIFSSYVSAGKVKEATMTFEVMDQYGCNHDIVALNSLLSAISRDGKTIQAFEFLHVAHQHMNIRPDADSYAILLEGWEKEMNVVSSRETFSEMIEWVGWDSRNVPAYDSFLCTLISCSEGTLMEEVLRHLERMKEKGCCPGIRFLTLALESCRKCNDVESAEFVWETMVGGGFGIKPDARLYNAMIVLYCCSKNSNRAIKLLDEMVCKRVLPDAQSYNGLFRFLIESRRLEGASALFKELDRNGCIPNQLNCGRAVEVFLESGYGGMAIQVWESMERHYKLDLEETGNLLIVGLVKLRLVPEAVVYSESMIEKGINLTSVTISVLEHCLTDVRKELVYERILRKWKNSFSEIEIM